MWKNQDQNSKVDSCRRLPLEGVGGEALTADSCCCGTFVWPSNIMVFNVYNWACFAATDLSQVFP